MYNAAIDRYEWNKLQGKNRYVAQLRSPSSCSSLCTDPINFSWGGGGVVCSQAYVVQVYFIHAYSIYCNRIPQMSNRERKMKKEHNKKCVEEKEAKLSSLPV